MFGEPANDGGCPLASASPPHVRLNPTPPPPPPPPPRYTQAFDDAPGGAAGEALETGEQVVLTGDACTPKPSPRLAGAKPPVSVLGLPLMHVHASAPAASLGAVEVSSSEREFDDGELKMAARFMVQASRVLTAHLT